MHPLNVSHLVIGLVLLGISGVWAADQAGWITDSTYVLPVLLIGAGAIGLLAFTLRGVGTRSTDSEPHVAEHHE
jgi:hypothetical protein